MTLLYKYLSLIRWPNLLIIVFTQYMARVFLVHDAYSWDQLLHDKNQFFITLCTVLVAAAGYIINDYFDIKIDHINKPDEVVIGRFIPRRHALFLYQVLNTTAVIISYTINFKVFLVNVLAINLLWFYASVFKKKPLIGNLLVSGLTGASLVVMAVFYTSDDKLINVYALFAFGISLIREIIKDMEDIRGDMLYDSKTLPIVYGLRKTKQLLYVFMILFVIGVAILAVLLNNYYLNVALLFLSIPFLYLAFRLYFADRKKHFSQLSLMSKIIMVLGILSMIFV